ncbi:hypothetical protein [Polyangium aurulentum]|uniref:hypothetical protein n=1 Tax=Polyangium aurulentum TaxID=2567896 RepID=UPI0010ADD223|nr:hypothetical protein [Polyangium aurulentum]UQA61846.1 hypothetical protein E8A73_015785 [Polyangium aurulentum]
MARSRSSFDFDLTSAIAAAASLSTEEKNKKVAPGLEPLPAGLVSFDPSQSASSDEMASTSPAPGAMGPTSESEGAFGESSTRNPPKLPDLSSIVSPVQRCERIVQWITEATGATDVFLADAAGLPLAGSVSDTESKLAGSGLVASSIASLAAAVPGNHAPLFELHVGEGPFFQLIGFQVGASLFIVGLNRTTPLTPKQAHAIRLACRHALGDTLRGGA